MVKKIDFYQRAKAVVASSPTMKSSNGSVTGKLVVAGGVPKGVVATASGPKVNARIDRRDHIAVAPRPTVVTEALVQFGLDISPYTFRDGLLVQNVETKTFNETFQKHMRPLRLDAFGLLDNSLRFSVTKGFVTTVGTVDGPQFAVSTNRLDTTVSVESIRLHPGRVVSDGFSRSDTVLLRPDKGVSDPVFLTDLSPTFDVGLRLADLVDATDDVLGSADMDDNQWVDFGKWSNDVLSPSEQVLTSAAYIRDLEDFVTHTDIAEVVYIKAIYERSYLELVYAPDAVEMHSEKYVSTDALVASETFSKLLSRPFLDIFASNDLVKIEPDKRINEVTALSESILGYCQGYFESDYVQAGYTGVILTV